MKGFINLAYYRKKDWKRFLEMIDDKESMHDTWEEWHKAFLNTKEMLKSQGFKVNEFQVDLDELQKFCSLKGIKNDGKARSQFVSNR
jgi:hypothetical protein